MGQTRKRRRTIKKLRRKLRRGGMHSIMKYLGNPLDVPYQANLLNPLIHSRTSKHSPTSNHSLTSNSIYLYGDGEFLPNYMTLKPDKISSIIESSELNLIKSIQQNPKIKEKILNIINKSNNDDLISVFKKVSGKVPTTPTDAPMELTPESMPIIQAVSKSYTMDNHGTIRALGRVFVILLFIVLSSCIATGAFGNQLAEDPIERFEIGIDHAMLAIVFYGGRPWIEIYDEIGRRRNGWFKKMLRTAMKLLLQR